eukprot:1161402-Pelagomonas_calceolata.AAC.2
MPGMGMGKHIKHRFSRLLFRGVRHTTEFSNICKDYKVRMQVMMQLEGGHIDDGLEEGRVPVKHCAHAPHFSESTREDPESQSSAAKVDKYRTLKTSIAE